MPEISTSSPFYSALAGLGNITESDVETQLYPAFKPLPDYDVVLQKTRYYAGTGNTLVQILRNQKIDTVILVCNFPVPIPELQQPLIMSMEPNNKNLNSRAFELQVSFSQRLNASSILILMCEYWRFGFVDSLST